MKGMLSVGAIFSALRLTPSGGGYAPPRRIGPKPQGGKGARLAAERLRAKAEANKGIPDATVYTRQRRRLVQREAQKRSLAVRKKRAMQSHRPGGAAAVR